MRKDCAMQTVYSVVEGFRERFLYDAGSPSTRVDKVVSRVEATTHSNVADPLVPTVAPTPVELPEKPNVWEMPNRGMQRCDCGQGCQIDQELVEEEFWLVLNDEPEWVSHQNLCRIIQEFWRYESVCNFFFDHVMLSARVVYGKIAEKYPYLIAVDIVGYFSKTWNGCPEMACEGGQDWSDIGQ